MSIQDIFYHIYQFSENTLNILFGNSQTLQLIIYLMDLLPQLSWCVAGCLWCITVVGIPIGMHDIRTPLALIVGYTDRLSKSPNLNQEEKALADAVCRQSLVIRQLITDLNLTSKLAYEAQPLNKKECSPALILRECAADIYNEKIEQDKGQEPEVDVELLIPADMEKVRIFADSGLLKRALRNLIGNSVRHNPGGCQVMVRLYEKNEKIYISVKDTGKGVPELVVQNMDNQTDKVHIMGLRLARQIVRAHGGELIFEKRESGTYDVTLELSVSKLHP